MAEPGCKFPCQGRQFAVGNGNAIFGNQGERGGVLRREPVHSGMSMLYLRRIAMPAV